jgi:hypothetical protein
MSNNQFNNILPNYEKMYNELLKNKSLEEIREDVWKEGFKRGKEIGWVKGMTEGSNDAWEKGRDIGIEQLMDEGEC